MEKINKCIIFSVFRLHIPQEMLDALNPLYARAKPLYIRAKPLYARAKSIISTC